MSGKDDVDELTASFKGMNLKKRVTFNPLMGSDSIDPTKRLPLVTGNRLSGNPYTRISTNPAAMANLQGQWPEKMPKGGRKRRSLQNKKNAKRKTRKTRKGKRSRKSSIRKTKTRKHRK
jgi:hypothetical protein